MNLTFGEQVKIILSRKGMTIKELAEQVEMHTGKPMSRQNMTQRLGRDNFQEQDMRLIAKILGCKFSLSIMEMDENAMPVQATVTNERELAAEMLKNVASNMDSRQVESEHESDPMVREITIGELVDMVDEVSEEVETEENINKEDTDVKAGTESAAEAVVEVETKVLGETDAIKSQVDQREREILRKGISGYFKKAGSKKEDTEVVGKPEVAKKAEEPILGEINPYTGKEYKTNSVRMHPKRIGYVQVYDQEQHKWTEMTEWAFLGYQERKKVLMGKDYEPPIYLD